MRPTTFRATTLHRHRVERVCDAGAAKAMVVRRDVLSLLEHGAFQLFAPAAMPWLSEKIVSDGKRLLDGRIVLATHQDGLLILTANGEIDEIVNSAAGLPEYLLSAVLPDREGALWLAIYGPLARIGIPSSVLNPPHPGGFKGEGGRP